MANTWMKHLAKERAKKSSQGKSVAEIAKAAKKSYKK